MKSRKGCPQQRGKSTKYRLPVVCLLVVSVLAPLVFLGRKASNFNPTLDRREFLEGFPSGKHAESGRLNAFDQIETLFPKSVLDVIIKHSEESEASDSNLLNGNPAWLHQPTFDLLTNSTSFSEDGVFEDHGQVLYGDEGRTGMVVQGARRGLRLRREKERLAELTQQDEEERERLEREAFKRAKEVDAPIIGKYSIWRREDSENSDAVVRLMRDQLIMARIYLSIAKAHNNAPLMRELKLKIRESLRAMGGSTIDNDLSRSAPEKIRAMGLLLARAREEHYDCNAIVRKLRAMLQTAEEYGRTLKKRSTFLSQLAAKTIPKGLHCLSLRLNVDYYNLDEEQQEFPRQDKLEDPSLYHYALFSDNVLATSVVVNSTVLHAQEPEKHVFHLVTDKLNYGAMKMWFLANPPRNATIHVQNIDDFKWLNSSYCPVLRQLESAAMKEYYFKPDQPTSLSSGTTNLKYRNPKYLSMLNHLRFYLPQIYPKLDKLLFLDDDIVVQKDLTALWKIDLQGKVNGAVETCGASFHRFDKYLNFSNPHIARNFDPNACGWAYGMNVFDLKEWKRQDITGIYHRWQNMNEERLLWKLGTLPPGLITFYNLTYPLDKTWHVLGLGYNPGIDKSEIDEAAVIHYNGNLKPWLDIGLARFKYFWAKYVKYDHSALQQCNIVH